MASPRRIVVRKIGPDGREAARYHGVVVQEDAEAITLMAKWESPQVDLCYVVLEPGDVFVEHFFRARWHNVFEIYQAADGCFLGWYCNVTRPPKISSTEIVWYDLALDLFVGPDGNTKALDEDEFEALGLRIKDPEAWRQAMLAWKYLLGLTERKELPFSGHPSSWTSR